MSGSPRVLVVKLGAMGDVVMASTILPAVRSQSPGAHITWLCGSRVAPLVRQFADVDETIEVDERAIFGSGAAARAVALAAVWRRLALRRADEVYLAQGDPRYRLLLATMRTGRVSTLRPHEPRAMLPIAGRWFGDEFARMVLQPGPARGPVAGHAPLAALRPLPAAPDSGVVLVPGGAKNVLRESALRRWPVERYAELARALVAEGHAVTLVGDANDAWVRPAFEGIGVRDAIGAHDIPGSLALLGAARLVITHDTGPMHLARLAGAPLLALFGPTMPSQFLSADRSVESLWGGADLACRPCYDGREFADCADNLCMREIALATVLERARARLGTAPQPSLGSAPTVSVSPVTTSTSGS